MDGLLPLLGKSKWKECSSSSHSNSMKFVCVAFIFWRMQPNWVEPPKLLKNFVLDTEEPVTSMAARCLQTTDVLSVAKPHCCLVSSACGRIVSRSNKQMQAAARSHATKSALSGADWGGGGGLLLNAELKQTNSMLVLFQGAWKLSGENWIWLNKPADANPKCRRSFLLMPENQTCLYTADK